MEVQIVISGTELLALMGVVIAGVFGLVVYINRQDNRTRELAEAQNERTREHVDRQNERTRAEIVAMRDHFDAKFDSLRDYMGDRIYDHGERLTKIEGKEEGEKSPQE